MTEHVSTALTLACECLSWLASWVSTWLHSLLTRCFHFTQLHRASPTQLHSLQRACVLLGLAAKPNCLSPALKTLLRVLSELHQPRRGVVCVKWVRFQVTCASPPVRECLDRPSLSFLPLSLSLSLTLSVSPSLSLPLSIPSSCSLCADRLSFIAYTDFE